MSICQDLLHRKQTKKGLAMSLWQTPADDFIAFFNALIARHLLSCTEITTTHETCVSQITKLETAEDIVSASVN